SSPCTSSGGSRHGGSAAAAAGGSGGPQYRWRTTAPAGSSTTRSAYAEAGVVSSQVRVAGSNQTGAGEATLAQPTGWRPRHARPPRICGNCRADGQGFLTLVRGRPGPG